MIQIELDDKEIVFLKDILRTHFHISAVAYRIYDKLPREMMPASLEEFDMQMREILQQREKDIKPKQT